MPKIKTHIEFVKEIGEILPELKIIGNYSTARKFILVEDCDGIQYMAKPGALMYGHHPSIINAIDKRKALQISVNKYRSDVVIKGEYKGVYTKILVEDEFGLEYMMTPNALRKLKNLTVYSTINRNRWFEVKARLVHGDKYYYGFVNYNKNKLVKIICPVHGMFEQIAYNHLIGRGCVKCGAISAMGKRESVGFSKTSWLLHCDENNKDAFLYIIECYQNEEKFIKIGITTQKINKRFLSTSMPYEFNLLYLYTDTPLLIFNKEKELHNHFKEYKYTPNIKFDGYTECFDISIKEELKNIEIIET